MARTTNFPNGLKSFLVDSNSVYKDANYTVVITTDSGKQFTTDLDGIVFTLPAIAIGNTFTIMYIGVDGGAAVNISPAAADGITYAGSGTDDVDLILTKATSKTGDYVTLASLAGTDAWQVVAVRGIWAKAS